LASAEHSQTILEKNVGPISSTYGSKIASAFATSVFAVHNFRTLPRRRCTIFLFLKPPHARKESERWKDTSVLRFHTCSQVADPRRVAILPGTYNPPTIAHVALAEHAVAMADEVLLLLPEVLPHKDFGGVGFGARLAMLTRAIEHPRMTVASSPGGLFLEIAREAVERYRGAEIALVCGRDAAQRILTWPYDGDDALDRFFAMAQLWVYARGGAFADESKHAHAIRTFDFDEELQCISSTEVRQRIARGDEWRMLVPQHIHEEVELLYGQQPSGLTAS
jgi:nicotinate (nicotinamide) nucleotide adenylyltransferase